MSNPRFRREWDRFQVRAHDLIHWELHQLVNFDAAGTEEVFGHTVWADPRPYLIRTRRKSRVRPPQRPKCGMNQSHNRPTTHPQARNALWNASLLRTFGLS